MYVRGILVAATSARELLKSAPGGMVEKQLVHASATPTSSELGTQGSSLHDKRQLTFLIAHVRDGMFQSCVAH